MFGLRQKLVLGFGGLLAILLGVSGLGVAVLQQHRNELNKFLYENWRSVEYGQKMLDSLDRLNDLAKAHAVDGGSPSPADATGAAAEAIKQFDQNLDAENHNLTLPNEDKLAAAVQSLWTGPGGYRPMLQALMDGPRNNASSIIAYNALEARSAQLKTADQAVIQLNLDNMTPIDGKMKAMADSATRLMVALAVAGATLAAVFIGLMSRSILQPIQTLTRSAREIDEGNLDLVVQVSSRDELWQLAEAFNSMAAKLREYRRTNRAKLVRTQQTTQNAINSLPDAVAILSPDGHIEMANTAAEKSFALRIDAHVNDLHADWLKTLFEKTAREMRPIEPRGYESALQVLDEKGGERFFLPHAVPIIDADGQLMGVTVVLADVTNLRRLDEMKSGMLSVVSHELKTPLTSIRMGVHLLLEERVGSLTPDQNDILSAVREDSDRLYTIVDNLLDMSRIESGRDLLDLKPEMPASLVAMAVETMEASYQDKGVSLVSDVPTDLPRVLADRSRMGHVFSNLLINALRYTPPGGQVRVDAVADGEFVKFSVADTGAGIPAQFKGRIFERFFRAPGQPSATGAGLGLAISKEIVQAHGGRISVEGGEGTGATFSFTLPQAGPAAGKHDSPHEPPLVDRALEREVAAAT